MTDLVKGFGEVKQNKVSLATSCRVPHRVCKESDKLGFARPLAAKPMLKIVQQVVIVHVGNHVRRNYMF